MNFVKCFNTHYKLGYPFEKYEAPFDVFLKEEESYFVQVYGEEFGGMKLTGSCDRLVFIDVSDFKRVDLSGFMDLEIGEMIVSYRDIGLLKILELKCKEVLCEDKLIEHIVNKYMDENDPLMRDFEGFKLEMAVSGYRNRL